MRETPDAVRRVILAVSSRMMTVTEAVMSRRSVRAFLDTPIPLPLIEQILTKASRAPSGETCSRGRSTSCRATRCGRLKREWPDGWRNRRKGIFRSNTRCIRSRSRCHIALPLQEWRSLLRARGHPARRQSRAGAVLRQELFFFQRAAGAVFEIVSTGRWDFAAVVAIWDVFGDGYAFCANPA